MCGVVVMLSCSAYFLLLPLILKTWRVFRVFNNESLSVRPIPDEFLLMVMVPPFILVVIILAVHYIVDAPVMLLQAYEINSEFSPVRYQEQRLASASCATQTIVGLICEVLLIVMFACAMTGLCVYAYLCRNAPNVL